MSAEAVATGIAAGIVVLIYHLLKGGVNKVKEMTAKDRHIETPEFLKEDINFDDKESTLKNIDFYIFHEDYDDALKLCNLFIEYKGEDKDIQKRIRHIQSNTPV